MVSSMNFDLLPTFSSIPRIGFEIDTLRGSCPPCSEGRPRHFSRIAKRITVAYRSSIGLLRTSVIGSHDVLHFHAQVFRNTTSAVVLVRKNKAKKMKSSSAVADFK